MHRSSRAVAVAEAARAKEPREQSAQRSWSPTRRERPSTWSCRSEKMPSRVCSSRQRSRTTLLEHRKQGSVVPNLVSIGVEDLPEALADPSVVAHDRAEVVELVRCGDANHLIGGCLQVFDVRLL